MPINSFLYPGAKVTPAYEVANSCRFNDDDNPKMVVTPSSSGTNAGKIYTLSAWVKFGNIGVDKTIWSCSTDTYIYITGAGVISCNFRRNGGTNYEYNSTRKLRDPSSWYHIVLRVDTTDSTDADKVQVYVNNQEDTPATTTYQNMADDYETGANVSGVEQRIGVYSDGSLDFDGYMAEVIMVDNQSLAPTEFGEYDEDSQNIWKPKDISDISVGTNGYYLDFEDSSNLGNNAAGSGSADLTETNLAATDQSTDSCTNNFATMNSIENTAASTFSEGNLQVLTHSGNFSYNISTIGVSAGKWYCEIKCTAQSSDENKFKVGIAGKTTASTSDFLGENTATDDTISYNGTDGDYQKAGTEVSYGDSYTTNDILGIALDVDNSKLYFSKNGTFQNSGDPTTGATGTGAISTGSPSTGFWHFAVGDIDNNTTYTYQVNFGNPVHSISSGNSDANGYGNFEYAVPSGYYALNTKNLAEYG